MKSKHKFPNVVSQFPVIVHADEDGGYWVECPVFEGCYSQGDTIEEALENIQEAIQLCAEEYSLTQLRKITTQSVSLHLVTA